MKLDSSVGLSDDEYNEIFTTDKPNIIVFHGYPNLIKELIYERTNRNVLILGYNEEGAITTPFDMRVRNKIDRFNICLNVAEYVKNNFNCSDLIKYSLMELLKHKDHIRVYGKDLDEVTNWKWSN